MDNQIKVGFLVSYDYEYLKYSLPIVYKEADYIALAIDNERKTWTGTPYDLPDEFFRWISEIDVNKKIHIYEDNFHLPKLTPMENDNRERQLLANFMGNGGWHIQIDSDEYYVDFAKFCSFLKSLDMSKKTLVLAEIITMLKQDDKGTYLVESPEVFAAATNNPNYISGRYSSNNDLTLTKTFKVLHQSWARSSEEIKQKISNWGHRDDFDTREYHKLLNFINTFNYKYIKYFHPLFPHFWHSLEYIQTKEINDMLEILKKRGIEAEANKVVSPRFTKEDFIAPIVLRGIRFLKKKLR